MCLKATIEVFQIMFIFFSTAFSCVRAEDSECFVNPQESRHTWNLSEPLKIDIFIPPKWDHNTEYKLTISIGKMSYILNSNQRIMSLKPRTFISFSKERKPKAGWTSIFILYRNNSVHFEDINGTTLLNPLAPSNLPSLESTPINVTVKGMNALINCNSHIRTFTIKSEYESQAGSGMPIPVTFFNNLTRIDFYGNTTAFDLQLMLKLRNFFICKKSTNPDSYELTTNPTYPSPHTLCGLLPMNIYNLKLNSSLLDQSNTERSNGVMAGIIRIYSGQGITYVRTFSSYPEIQPRSADTEARISENSSFLHYLPALIAVSVSLAILLLLVIGCIVYYILYQKAKRKQEQLSSSGSWTQQNFASINSATDFYIQNEVYERPGAKSIKKFSISSEYSNPADEEYDEPIYSDGRESIYESIYESTYVSPTDAGNN